MEHGLASHVLYAAATSGSPSTGTTTPPTPGRTASVPSAVRAEATAARPATLVPYTCPSRCRLTRISVWVPAGTDGSVPAGVPVPV